MHVVITGANRGIGAEMRAQYSASGADVTGTSRCSMDGLLPLDVTDPASVALFAQGLAGRPVDLLICNAGVYADKSQELGDGYPPQMWAQTFSANVTGVFLSIQALLPNIRAAQDGRIAIISSIMASDERAPGGSYIYRASKAAVLNLGRNMAADLAGEGIPVGIYHPGWVTTDMGGDAADIDAGTSAKGLIDRFAALTPETTGCFEDYAGRAIAF
jgi:NAD(P)-dependent dehydrogenase (short-subunit alcohol dehydrogenase family)